MTIEAIGYVFADGVLVGLRAAAYRFKTPFIEAPRMQLYDVLEVSLHRRLRVFRVPHRGVLFYLPLILKF